MSESKEGTAKINLHQLNDLPLPFWVTEEQLSHLKTAELFQDDIWVVTYPKSGTTWMQQIIRSILSRGDESEEIEAAVPWIEGANSKTLPYDVDISTLERPRAFKSHMPYNGMPCGLPSTTPCKYIYVARNPKDVAVSSFYHHFSFKFAENFDWDTFTSWFLSGKLLYGDHLEHVLSWWEHRNDDNVLFMKYEDMKKDLASSVAKVASFINKNLSKKEIDLVVEKSSFSSMKKNPTINREDIPKELRHPDHTPFIRKGIVGDWKEHFSPQLSAKFDEIYTKAFETSGLQLESE